MRKKKIKKEQELRQKRKVRKKVKKRVSVEEPRVPKQKEPAVRRKKEKTLVKKKKKMVARSHASEENKKEKKRRISVQKTIAYKEMGRDGICKVKDGVYSKTIRDMMSIAIKWMRLRITHII